MKWTDEETKYLIENYQLLDNKDIAYNLNRSINSINQRANRLNIKRNKSNIRKYYFNENYFDNLTKTGAYILGYTMADGCINTNKKHEYRISYHINQKDIEILDLIKTELKLDKKYRFNHTLNKKTNKRYESVQLQFNSEIVYNSLQKYGIVNRKTGLESLDNIPKQFLIDFILGYFDGDGSCLKSKTNQFSFSLVSANQKFLEQIKFILGGYGKISPHSSIFQLKVTGINNIANIGKILYQDTNLGLLRKKQIMMDIINHSERE